ncbi:hypothetical protein ABVB72_17630 [Rhizobium nepotum]|uniref:hypothetical protein n=1 Tax=Rhizobium nepotum TaxID=1035271 RepID=UPI00336A00BD
MTGANFPEVRSPTGRVIMPDEEETVMPIMENTPQRPNALEGMLMHDDALQAEIRSHLRFTQWIGRIMIGFLFFLLCAVVFHFIVVNF